MAITAAQLDVKINVNGAGQAQGALSGLGNAVDSTAKKSNILSQAFATGVGFVGAQVFMRATDAVVDFGRAIVDTGLSFEAQMSAVRAVTGATGAELQSLTDLALQIGKDTQFGASEAAIALEELAKAGMSVDAILNGAANSTAMLAAAGGVDMPSAAMVMAAAMNQFGIAAEDSMRVADLLAAASAVSATGVLELGESLKYVGVQANAMGYDIETITTALAIMADQGLVGSQAGTSLNQALLSLANPTAKAKTLMGQLGLSFTDLNGNMLPLPDIIAQLNTSLEGYGDAQRVAYLETLFGVEGGRAMNALLVSQTDAAIEAGKGWDSYYAAVTESGIASEQAAARMDNTMGSIEEFKGALETLAIMASMMILPAFRGLVDAGAELAEGAISWLSDIQRFMSPESGLGAMEAVLLSTQIALSKVFGGAAATRIMKPIRDIVKHLGTAQRVLRSIGSLISGAFGKALDVLVDNLDLVAGALKGIAVAAAVFLGWTAFTAIIGGLAAALGLLLSPIGLLIAGVAGLGIAWERNLFGIQDAMEPVIDLLDTFGSMIRAVVMYGDDYTDWLRFFPGWAQPVATAIGEIIEGFQGLTDAFQAGGWRGALSELGNIGGRILDWTLDVAAPAITGWIADNAGNVWDAVTSAAGWVGTMAGEIGAWVLDVATPTVTGWLTSSAANMWPALQAASGFVGTVLGTLSAWTLDVSAPTITGWFDDVAGWFSAQLPDDWSAVGTAVRDKFVAAVTGAFSSGQDIGAGIGSIGPGIIDSITQAIANVDWNNAGGVAAQMFINALKAAFGMMSLGPTFIAGITTGLAEADWSSIAVSIKDYIVTAISAQQGFAEGFGTTLFSELQQALGNVNWGNLAATIATKLGEAIPEVVNFGAFLGSKLYDEFVQAVNGIAWGSIASTIGSKLGDAISSAENFAADLGTTLLSEIQQAISGLDAGAMGGWLKDKFVAAAEGVGQAMADAILAGMPGWLKDFLGLESGGGGEKPSFASFDFTSILQGLDDVKGRFAEGLDTSAFTGGLETAKAALVDIATTAQMQVLAMQMAGLQMGQAFGSGVSIGVTASAGNVSAAMASYVAAANASQPAMMAAGLGAGTGYGTGVAAGIRLHGGSVSSAIASYVSIASGYRGAMMAAGIGVGAALGQGIAAGIRSQVGNIAAAAAAAVTSAIAAAKAAGAIASPSRVMQDEVGRMLGLGVERGILDSLTGVHRAADQLVHVPAVPMGSGAGYGSGGGTSSSVAPTYVTYEVTVNVEGNVTTEDNLLTTFTERFSQALVDETQRRNIAMGVES